MTVTKMLSRCGTQVCRLSPVKWAKSRAFLAKKNAEDSDFSVRLVRGTDEREFADRRRRATYSRDLRVMSPADDGEENELGCKGGFGDCNIPRYHCAKSLFCLVSLQSLRVVYILLMLG